MSGCKKYFLVIPVILFSSLFIFHKATAASQQLTITPTSFQLTINKGSSYSGHFTLLNQSSNSYSLKYYSTPYSVQGEQYTPDFEALPNSPNVVSWINFNQNSPSLSPNSTKDISYTINVPSNTPAGGYYAVGFAETNNPKSPVGVTINERLGSIFYITVPGKIYQEGNLESFQANFLQYPNLTSNLRVKDGGALHFKADYDYYVKDIFGGTKYHLVGSKYLLPHTIRKIPLTWKNTPSFGIFKVGGKVSILGNESAFGYKYVIVMSKAVRFISLGILSVLVFLVVAILFRKNRKQSKRYRR